MNSNHSVHRRSANTSQTDLSRRNFLRGVGVSLAVPALPSLVSSSAVAAGCRRGRRTRDDPMGSVADGVRLRSQWRAPGALVAQRCGGRLRADPTLELLEKVRQHVQVLGGLDHLNAIGGLDGPGDHWRGPGGTFLTGVRRAKDCWRRHSRRRVGRPGCGPASRALS